MLLADYLGTQVVEKVQVLNVCLRTIESAMTEGSISVMIPLKFAKFVFRSLSVHCYVTNASHVLLNMEMMR